MGVCEPQAGVEQSCNLMRDKQHGDYSHRFEVLT